MDIGRQYQAAADQDTWRKRFRCAAKCRIEDDRAVKVKQKCLPILLYGLDVCYLDKRSVHLFGCELLSVCCRPNVTIDTLQTFVKFYFI